MELAGKTIGVAMSGSFCTYGECISGTSETGGGGGKGADYFFRGGSDD